MKRQKRTKQPSEIKIRRAAAITIICDVILLTAFVITLLTYISRSNVKSFEQNSENIFGIAQSNSQLVQSALDNASHEVLSAFNYCEGKSVREILDYLSVIANEGEEYQLLRRDDAVSTELFHVYTGYSTVKQYNNYVELTYESTSLATSLYNYAAREDGAVSYTQSFTNKTDAMRYFAVFCGITVDVNGSPSQYFLVKPQSESKVLDQIRTYSQYEDLAVAVCYTDGKYLAQDANFRANNFYDYLYKYNGLSIDDKNAIRAAVQADTDGGVLEYNDFKQRECVFAYAPCGDSNNWLVLVSVPVSEFTTETLMSFFPLIIISFLSVLLFFNIYQLLKIVQELRQSVARERIASRAKSSFLSRMSHEIRTPLNAVIGYCTIARSEMSGEKTEAEQKQASMKVLDCLTKSDIASKHLLTIINDVLDMSSIESGKIKVARDRFDFKGLITSLTTVFYSQAKAKDIDFNVILDPLTEEWFIGDQMRINQILANLISNAVKFTPEGGSITVSVSQPEAVTNPTHIHFEISDTGIGMTPEYLTRLWTPFEQADSSISRRFGGTGLGLSITKNLIDIMGGTITVDSTPGKGTTFHVDLTLEKTTQPSSDGAYDFSSINALVIDDDESTCDYIRLLFNRCGAKCAAVSSGSSAVKAIELAKERNERYTLCLVDWHMPGMDGIETVRRIRELAGNDVPVIVLTAYDYSEVIEKATEVGVTRFVSKPLFQSSLFDILANVCSSKPRNVVSKRDSYDFSGARVLLAEDNAMNMEIAKTILESAGLVVESVWNGKEAVAAFEASESGYYSAILMDVHMPEMNGHDATRAIRASSHSDATTVPIIAMTADAFAENVGEARAAGMNDHVAKPIDILTLFSTLQKYI